MHRSNHSLFRVAAFVAVSALFWGIFPLVGNASVKVDNLVRAIVPLTPHLEEFAMEDYLFLIDDTPIKRSDGSTWYRIEFEIEGLYYQVKQDALRWPSGHYPAPEFSPPYVNAKYIKKMPLSQADKAAIEDFKRGRPCRIKVGDVMSDHFHTFMAITQKETSLYKKPEKNSQRLILPKGSKIIYPVEHPSSGNTEPFLGTYLDMDDIIWLPIIDVKSKKMLGWFGPDAGDFFEIMGEEIEVS